MASGLQTEFRPTTLTPPGATLEDLLDEWGMSQAQLAERMGRPAKTINEIIKGKNAITTETALQLERVFGTPAGFWLEREQKYRTHLAMTAEASRLKREQGWLKKVPLKELIKRGFIPDNLSELNTLKAVWTFFGVTGPDPWNAVYEGVAYRRSIKTDPVLIASWLRMGELLARQARCVPYDPKVFRDALREIREWTLEPPQGFVDRMIDRCAQCGVALVFVKELPGLGISGVTRWLNPSKALIQICLRYKTSDQLWFTFFHEAAHILKHGKKLVFLEIDGLDGEAEDEANAFASEILIPRPAYSEFVSHTSRFSRQAVLDFARTQGIHPGIVVGRLQHDQYLEYSHLNDLKTKLEWASAKEG
jgi:addiction module HigA family antidote